MKDVSILHLGNDGLSADQVEQHVRAALPICRLRRATSLEAWRASLDSDGEQFDVLLCDCDSADVDCAAALTIAKLKRPNTPIVFIAGSDGEERVIELLTRGATDYVLRNQLNRFNSVLHRALEESQNHRDCQRLMTELASGAERARVSDRRFFELADAMPQIVWTARPDGYIDYYNERWYEFSGYPRGIGGEASWTPIIYPDDLDRARVQWHAAIVAGSPLRLEVRFYDRASKTHRWFLTRATPIRDGGEIVRWFGSCTDIDDQRRATADLQIARQQLMLALTAVQMGTWQVDMRTLEMTCSDTCKANYGRGPGEAFSYVDLANTVHPDDRQRWEKVISDGIVGAHDFDVEYRVRWPDKSEHWVLVRAGCMTGESGKVIALTGVSLDITDRKRADARRNDPMKLDEGRSQHLTVPPVVNAGAAALAFTAPLDGRRILVVDDEQESRSLLCKMLTDHKATVTTAGSASEGLDLLSRGGFDVIVSDIAMPGVDGFEFIRQVRAMPDGIHSTPAVALTAFARAEDRSRVLAAGYQAHVAKPLEVSELVNVVAATVDGGIGQKEQSN